MAPTLCTEQPQIPIIASRRFDVQVVLPYSTAAMAHMFRSLRLSLADALVPKHFMYRYAREQGLVRSYSRLNRQSRDLGKTPRSYEQAFERTSFGQEPQQAAAKVGPDWLPVWCRATG